MKTVLVTGGAGFIGSHLCKRLLDEGHTVISLDNYFTGSKENHVSGVTYREGHTKDIARLIPESPDLIYHLGEYARVEQSVLEPDVVYDLNVLGTAAVIAYWKEKKCKLVYAGSSTKFGDGGLARTATPYAKSKADNSDLVKKTGDTLGLPYAITYFYNVFGEGERAGTYGTVIEIFKQLYERGAPLTVTSPGTQTRNFTHVDDIVDGLMAVGEKGEGDEYGLGNEKVFSMLDVARLFGTDILMLPERPGNRMGSELETSRARALGWEAERRLEDYIQEFLGSTRPRKTLEKRVLVFSTTFHPVSGPAEEALISLMRAMPDVQFDIVTAAFSKTAKETDSPVANATIYRVGSGRAFDKYLLPLLGFRVARKLYATHSYLFAWSIFASYAALAAILLKRTTGLPLLITLADQNIEEVVSWKKAFLRLALSDADQVYGIDSKDERKAARLLKRASLRRSMGEGDAFANQIRFVYANILRQAPRRKKRVLIFSLAYFPKHVGGAEVSIKEITDRLPEIEFHMITNRYDSSLLRTEKIGNVVVHRIGFAKNNPSATDLKTFPLFLNKYLYQVTAPFHALALHRKLHFSAIWAMMAHATGIPAGIFKTFKPSVLYILNLQEGDPPDYIEKKMRIVWPLFTRAFTTADIVQPLSTYLAEWAKRMGYKGKVVIVPNAVDAKHFAESYPPEVLDALKRKFEKKAGDVFLITTSRLVHKNAVDDVIRSLPLLPKKVKFLVLGVGPDERMLKDIAMREGVSDRVRFLGQVGHEELPQYLKISDIFVRPSRSEGFGASFPEAMVAGIPIIATQEGGLSDFLFDAKRNPDKPTTGWAVQKDSPQEIAAAVKDILAHPDTAAKVTKTAYELAFSEYDWDTIATTMREKVFSATMN